MSRRALVGLLALSVLVLAAATAPAEAQVQSQRVASGLSRPVFATAPANDPDRLFVLEKLGRIRIIKNGVLQATPFLNITGEVQNAGNEQGLLGLAFDPDYATNGHFYVYHIAGTGAGNSVIRRYTVTSNPDSADAASRHKVLKIPQTQSNHNGGTIAFGPDGYMYLGLGDGGGANDTNDRAQNGLEYLGKLLRIDVNGDDFPADSLQNYAIPPDNPYRTDPTFHSEIWSYGWRNPYRFSFDQGTGDIYFGDVGQNCWEEIDIQPASSTGRENWGWNLMEGTHCFSKTNPFNCNPGGCNPAPLELPVHEYPHGGRCSVTGGFVYRGADIPAMDGVYFFADYCSRQIWTFRWDGSNVNEFTDRTAELDPIDGTTIGNITGFGEDARGELYIADRGGEIFKILPELSIMEVSGDNAAPFLADSRSFTWEDLEATSSHLIASYKVYRSDDDPTGLFTCVHESPENTWAGGDPDRPLVSGVYYYLVTALNAAGQETRPGNWSDGTPRTVDTSSVCP